MPKTWDIASNRELFCYAIRHMDQLVDIEAEEMDATAVAKFPLHRNVVKLFCTLPHGHDVTIDCFYLYLCSSKFEI